MKRLACVCFMVCAGPVNADKDLYGWAQKSVADGGALSICISTLSRESTPEPACFGKVEPDGDNAVPTTRYEIGSISKALTNLLLAELVATDAVTYDTTIVDILGDRIDPKNAAVGAITLMELATHHSGLPRLPGNMLFRDPTDPYASFTPDRLISAIDNARVAQPLIKHYAYSNFGVGLLGYLLGVVHGEGYETALREMVLEPAGLTEVTLDVRPTDAVGYRDGDVVSFWRFTDALVGAGGIRAAAVDLLQLARIMTGESPWPFSHAFNDDLQVTAPAGDSFELTRVWHVASDDEPQVFWHNGGTGGFWSFFGFRPDDGSAIVILVAGNDQPTSVGLQWLRARFDQDASIAPDPTVTGQYQFNAAMGLMVYSDENRLFAKLSGQPPIALSARDGDWYAISSVDASLHFVREGGEVIAVELAQNGIVQRAERTSDEPQRIERPVVTLSPEQLDKFVGIYAINEQVKFIIRRADDGLEAKLTGQQFYPIFAAGDDVFFYKVVEAELHFERDDDGHVTALTLHQGPVVQRAERTE